MITVMICFICFLIGYYVANCRNAVTIKKSKSLYHVAMYDALMLRARVAELEKKLTWSEILIEAENGDIDALFARRSVTCISTHPMYTNLTFEEIYKSLMSKRI